MAFLVNKRKRKYVEVRTLLSFCELERPRIDIELYGTDTHIPPIDKVRIMDEHSFEQFTLEWLYGCKKTKYSSIKQIGGAGDKGRDIVAYYGNGSMDYYQCKHYKTSLMPSNYYLELGKLCYYTYKKEISVPKEYYIIASNDVGPSLQDLLDNPTELLSELIKNWDVHCKSKITKTTEVLLEKEFLDYVRAFDFTIIKTYPMSQIIDEYLDTIYGKIRFGGRSFTVPAVLAPSAKIEPEEMNYISALLEAYSEEIGVHVDSIETLKKYNTYFKHLNRQRKDYYCVETIRRFIRDTATDSRQFEVLKEEIYNGIIDVHEQDYENGYNRLVADLKQATIINTSKCLLDSKLHCIGSNERKGTCHMLVNDNKLKWVDEK